MPLEQPAKVFICNRTLAKAEVLKAEFQDYNDVIFEVSTDVKAAVKLSDIILCATNSATPVLESEWLKPNAYVSSIGPKFEGKHELPIDIAERASIVVSDAPEQLKAYPANYFLSDISMVNALESIEERPQIPGYSVFLSSGRSGTEVVVADSALAYFFNE